MVVACPRPAPAAAEEQLGQGFPSQVSGLVLVPCKLPGPPALQPQARLRASSCIFTLQALEFVYQVLSWALGTQQGTRQIKIPLEFIRYKMRLINK